MKKRTIAKYGLPEMTNETYSAIVAYVLHHGYAPSVRELVDILEVNSTGTVHHHMKKLFKLGLLETEAGEGVARAYRVKAIKPIYKGIE